MSAPPTARIRSTLDAGVDRGAAGGPARRRLHGRGRAGGARRPGASCCPGRSTSRCTCGASQESSRSGTLVKLFVLDVPVPVDDARAGVRAALARASGGARARSTPRRGGRPARPHRAARRRADRLRPAAARGTEPSRPDHVAGVHGPSAHALAPDRAPAGRDGARRRHRLRGSRRSSPRGTAAGSSRPTSTSARSTSRPSTPS